MENKDSINTNQEIGEKLHAFLLELKKEQGKFKIDRTYLAIVGADLLQEQIF